MGFLLCDLTERAKSLFPVLQQDSTYVRQHILILIDDVHLCGFKVR